MFNSVNLQLGEEEGDVNVGKWVFCQLWGISECVVSSEEEIANTGLMSTDVFFV